MMIPDLTLLRYICLEQSNNTKGSGVCVYFKGLLAVYFPYLKKYILLEDFNQNKDGWVVSLYGPPSQAQDQFNDFLLNFEQLLFDITSCNPSFLLITSNFNLTTSSW